MGRDIRLTDRFDNLWRPHRVQVALAAFGVQKRDHACERNRVIGSQLTGRVDEGFEEIFPSHQLRIGGIPNVVAVGVGLRERVALEHEGRRAERLEHPPGRRAVDLAVVQIGQHDPVALDHECAVVGSILVRRNAGPARHRRHLPVRQLGDLLEPQLIELVAHDVDAEPRNQHLRLLRDAAQRRVVKVIEVMVRQVHVVGIEHFRRHFDVGREVPPRSPVARARQPRVDEKPFPSGFDVEAGVSDDREPH